MRPSPLNDAVRSVLKANWSIKLAQVMNDVKVNELSVSNLNSLYATDSTSTDQCDLFIKSRDFVRSRR